MAIVRFGGKRFALSTVIRWWLKETGKGVVIAAILFCVLFAIARTVGIWFPNGQWLTLAVLAAGFLLFDTFSYNPLFVGRYPGITKSHFLRKLAMAFFALVYISVFAVAIYILSTRLHGDGWFRDVIWGALLSVAAALVLAPIAKLLNPREMLLMTGPSCPSCGVEMVRVRGGVETSYSDRVYGRGRVARSASMSYVVEKSCPNCGHSESDAIAHY